MIFKLLLTSKRMGGKCLHNCERNFGSACSQWRHFRSAALRALNEFSLITRKRLEIHEGQWLHAACCCCCCCRGITDDIYSSDQIFKTGAEQEDIARFYWLNLVLYIVKGNFVAAQHMKVMASILKLFWCHSAIFTHDADMKGRLPYETLSPQSRNR
jgi:hypothetical protein